MEKKLCVKNFVCVLGPYRLRLSFDNKENVILYNDELKSYSFSDPEVYKIFDLAFRKLLELTVVKEDYFDCSSDDKTILGDALI